MINPLIELQMNEYQIEQSGLEIGFAPLVSANAKVLILGSMPSVVSVQKQQYYGHNRNQFWPILGHLFQFNPKASYSERTHQAMCAGVAIWDVIARCHRIGSADSAIEPDSIQVQDFDTFFSTYPNIEHVFFNGRKAEQVYRAQVLPSLSGDFDYLTHQCLPSTSPAYANLSVTDKLKAWQCVKVNQLDAMREIA